MKRNNPLTAVALLLTLLLSSCGMDFNTQEMDGMAATDMQLNHHEAYTFVGDTIMLTPLFTPEDVVNKEIYWMTSNEDVLAFNENKFVGESVGSATVYATSVNQRISDTCRVTVMEPWDIDEVSLPADMVIYANVTFHGEPIDSTMKVAAFCDGSLRGLGRLRTQHGITYTELRVFSEYMEGEDPEMPWASETINFRLYDTKTYQLYDFPTTVTYDVETHGTLSNLFELSIP